LDKAAEDEGKKTIKQLDDRISIPLQVKVDPERAKELQNKLDELQKEYVERSIQVQKKLKSFWTDKNHVALAGGLVETEAIEEHNMWVMNYTVEYFEKRLSNIEAIVQSITEKLDLDLPKVKEEMRSLRETLSSPEVSTVANFIKRALKRDAKIKAEYEKKMRENDLAT
jgi:Ni,Fe-hydrogenase I large subunit